jgi:ATP-dependent DNA helicase RecG
VIQYKGNGRLETLREREFESGYAVGFDFALEYISGLLPANEVLGKALRSNVTMFPEIAIRELVANALIHQDFSIQGAGPMFEIFDGRIEVTNPGKALVEPDRLVDSPPASRNDLIASLMRRLGVSEERGSGWDKIAGQVELFQLPSPLVEEYPDALRVVLFAQEPLAKMDKKSKIRAVYLHACLRHVLREKTTNSSIRERFGIHSKNSAVASRLIKDAIEANMIAVSKDSDSPKNASYVPYWANT